MRSLAVLFVTVRISFGLLPMAAFQVVNKVCLRGLPLTVPLGTILTIAPAFGSAPCKVPIEVRNRVKTKSVIEQETAFGSWYANQKQFKCAADSFAAAAKLDPNSASLSYLWGLSLYSAGNNEASLAPLRHGAELDPGDIRPHLVLGAALSQSKQTAEAESEWRKALAIDRNSTVALDGLSQDLIEQKDYTGIILLLDKPSSSGQLSAVQALNLGIALGAASRLDDAATVLREGIDRNPDSLPIASELTVVLMLMGRVEEAYAVFDRVLARHPNDKATQVLYLNTLVTSHSDKAPAYAKELLGDYPDDWQVLYLNGVVASAEGDNQHARDFVTKSVSLHANDPQSQHLLASTLAKLGDLTGAIEHLEKAIELGDNQPEVHYELGKALRASGYSQRAAEQLRIYQQLKDSQNSKTQAAGKAEIADQQMKTGDTASAVSLYREAIESDPQEPLLYYKLSKALEQINDIAGEKEALQRALELDPNLPEAQNQAGYIAIRQGDAATAEGYFRAAVRASPSYIIAWINLAATLASESRWQDADNAIEHALVLDPDNAQAKKLREAVAVAQGNP